MLLVLYTSLITTDPVLRMSPAKERERSMMIAAVPDAKENAWLILNQICNQPEQIVLYGQSLGSTGPDGMGGAECG
eukprot:scaffold26126_cov76-Cyclotella_meneghiniana.AAC.1